LRDEDCIPRMRALRLLCTFLAVAVVTGCTTIPFSSTAERDVTLAPYRDKKIGDAPLEWFLKLRTGIVVANTELTFDYAGESTLNFHVSNKETSHSGCAAAIDSRGYFLTAAHVVRDGPITVFFHDGKDVQHRTARLVWLGDNAPGKPDLALLHIDASLPHIFAWSQNNQAGNVVFASGLNYDPKNKAPVFILSIVAGRLLTVPASAPTPDQTCNFSSDLPLHQGDSGGPLVDTNGRLLGINGVVKYNFLKSLGLPGKLTCYAIRPDTVWLDQLIETDFASQRSATPDSTRKARD